MKLDPKFTEAYFNRGLARAKLGRHETAIQDFSEAIRLAPKDPELIFSRGVAYLHVAKYDYAARDFTAVILSQPRNAQAYVYRGIARTFQNRNNDADVDFHKAFQLDPSLTSKVQPLINEIKEHVDVKKDK